MSPEAGKYFAERFTLMERLIAEGKLPDDIHVWPRWFYFGHKLLFSYHQPVEKREFRCTLCMHDWTGEPSDGPCPKCRSPEQVFQLNIDHGGQWQCVECAHEWYSEVGWKCPSCGALKEAPRWKCSGWPEHTWISETHGPCPECGKPPKNG